MLAAKGIAVLKLPEAVKKILHYLDDPAWHETILLAVGALGLVMQRPADAGELLCALCAAELGGDAYGRPVVLAGEALLDVGEVGVGRKAATQVTARLVGVMQDAAAPIRTRREAGWVLGKLGWQPEDLDGFVEIPAGKFLYGDGKEERAIAQPYWIGKYPVTNVQYARFVEDGGYDNADYWSAEGWAWRTGRYDSKAPVYLRDWLSKRPPEKRNQPFWWDDEKWNNPLFPVVGVSWFEAEAYCRWLENQLHVAGSTLKVWTGEAVREINLQPGTFNVQLPSEAEWERAARGVEGREYPWGTAFEAACLNCAGAWAGRDLSDHDKWSKWLEERPEYVGTTAVSTYPQGASPAGVWDLSGNVWEWTGSAWDADNKVLRGGSWTSNRRDARCASRFRSVPDLFGNNRGFRVVVSLVRG
jgi:formylglycine-generating enzyme required for sulfatase activity